MPFQPFGPPRRVPPHSPLDDVSADAPTRFRLTLADAGRRNAAIDVMLERLPNELTIEADRHDAEDAVLSVASSFSPGDAAILRPVNVLRRAGIHAGGLEVLDLVTQLDDDALRRAVSDWAEYGNNGPYRRRLERLAGPSLLGRCLSQMETADEGGPLRRASWRFAIRCVAFNTPGSEGRLLELASASRDDRDVDALVEAAGLRVELSALTAARLDVPPAALAAVIRRKGYVSERGSRLAWRLPEPLPTEIVDALCSVSRAGGDAAVAAVMALIKAEATSTVRSALDAALASGEPDLQAQALETFAAHWRDEARPTWRAFLEAKSAALRLGAEEVIGRYGTEDDVEVAAIHLARLLRSRSQLPADPPRGSQIVNLLVRHRAHPAARAALEDVSARWERLSDDLRRWLAEHHRWLDPRHRFDTPREVEADPEEPAHWPAPAIERDDEGLRLTFSEEAAHSEARDRFEQLVERHPAVVVLASDREWITVEMRGRADPELLVDELWEAAHSQADGHG